MGDSFIRATVTFLSRYTAVERETAMQIQRALPADLWQRLRHELDKRCTDTDKRKRVEGGCAVAYRPGRDLLMCDSGLRREEAANAQRDKLQASIYGNRCFLHTTEEA
jgi:hypothetical protein